ncbi:hypothetical protein chiPu_0016329 [Chiloscyllium punctatum]|uniref:Dynein heavy chain tail domain-containing protein n=1 Tax=Chiloscyllium punctatum TaxID=137246 RepID=A0A401T5B6_CHIPU|nr:hypothetical protein [Chiloscyllium punctatum]
MPGCRKKSSQILKSPQGMSIVRKYNKIAYVLVKFETLYHKAWIKEISAIAYMLQSTLLIRDPETGKLYSNFDHRILEILRESKCMLKMGLEVPEIAKRLLKIENTLKSNCNNLEVGHILFLCDMIRMCLAISVWMIIGWPSSIESKIEW